MKATGEKLSGFGIYMDLMFWFEESLLIYRPEAISYTSLVIRKSHQPNWPADLDLIVKVKTVEVAEQLRPLAREDRKYWLEAYIFGLSNLRLEAVVAQKLATQAAMAWQERQPPAGQLRLAM